MDTSSRTRNSNCLLSEKDSEEIKLITEGILPISFSRYEGFPTFLGVRDFPTENRPIRHQIPHEQLPLEMWRMAITKEQSIIENNLLIANQLRILTISFHSMFDNEINSLDSVCSMPRFPPIWAINSNEEISRWEINSHVKVKEEIYSKDMI
jgi:hypothetical protein